MIDTKSVSPLLMGSLSLKAGEKLLNCWSSYLSYQNIGEQMDKVMLGRDSTEATLKGIIVVTNQRLLFVEESGASSKTYNLRDYVELESATGTSSGKNQFSVTVEKDGTVKSLFFSEIRDCNPSTLGKLEKIDTGRIKIYIDKLVNNRIRKIDEEKRNRVESERQKRAGEKTIKCPRCGTLNAYGECICRDCRALLTGAAPRSREYGGHSDGIKSSKHFTTMFVSSYGGALLVLALLVLVASWVLSENLAHQVGTGTYSGDLQDAADLAVLYGRLWNIGVIVAVFGGIVVAFSEVQK